MDCIPVDMEDRMTDEGLILEKYPGKKTRIIFFLKSKIIIFEIPNKQNKKLFRDETLQC